MPQFIMEGARDCAESESDFVMGFIEVLFFTNSSHYPAEGFFKKKVQKEIASGQADGCLPSDVGYSDIHPDSLKKIREFCQEWQEKNRELLEMAYQLDYDEMQAGRDFHFTHCGHGVGFWDRDELKDDEFPNLADDLSEAAGNGEVNPFFGGHVKYGNAPFVHVELY